MILTTNSLGIYKKITHSSLNAGSFPVPSCGELGQEQKIINYRRSKTTKLLKICYHPLPPLCFLDVKFFSKTHAMKWFFLLVFFVLREENSTEWFLAFYSVTQLIDWTHPQCGFVDVRWYFASICSVTWPSNTAVRNATHLHDQMNICTSSDQKLKGTWNVRETSCESTSVQRGGGTAHSIPWTVHGFWMRTPLPFPSFSSLADFQWVFCTISETHFPIYGLQRENSSMQNITIACNH